MEEQPTSQTGTPVKSTPRPQKELLDFLDRMAAWEDIVSAPAGMED